MNLDNDAQRHLRALLRHLGLNPLDLNSITFNLNKATANVSKKRGVGVEDTSQGMDGMVYLDKAAVEWVDTVDIPTVDE